MSLSKRASKAAHHHLRRATEVELNLIPLIDIMSVMVAFLLVYSTEVEVVQNGKGVAIPQSIVQDKPRESIVVTITRDELLVQGEFVASVSEIRAADSPLIDPLSAVLSRPMLLGGDASEELAAREITLIADKSLPYDIVKRVMSTCTDGGYGRISLAVLEKESSPQI